MNDLPESALYLYIEMGTKLLLDAMEDSGVDVFRETERLLIFEAMYRSEWNQKKAAKMLGIQPRKMHYKYHQAVKKLLEECPELAQEIEAKTEESELNNKSKIKMTYGG